MTRTLLVLLLTTICTVRGLQVVERGINTPVPASLDVRNLDSLGGTADTPEAAAISDDQKASPESITAVTQLKTLLLEGTAKLKHVQGYTAVFSKEERFRGKLQGVELVDLKLRHQPFAAYMKWQEVPQEALYCCGREEDQVLVRMAGFKSLLGVLRLEPDCKLALSETRHPITELGIMKLAERLLAHCERDLRAGHGFSLKQLPDAVVADRDCYAFIAEYTDQELEPEYRKSLIWIDKEYSLPTSLINYEWGDDPSTVSSDALDQETFVEHYSYRNLVFKSDFCDADFAASNSEYVFAR